MAALEDEIIFWGLFDSGNGCYARIAKEFPNVKLYPIGIDKTNRNEHFLHLNLADYSRMFGDMTLFDELDKLPKPDVILASPPCESWSIASAMKDGNASWKQEKGDSLFSPQKPLSRFTIRGYKDYEDYQFKPRKSLLNRINGELCTVNTIEIIERYQPKVFVIENPAQSRMWDYIEEILGVFIPRENKTYYNNYDYPTSKETKFKSNIELNLKHVKMPNDVVFGEWTRDYNKRSNIPDNLVRDIFGKIVREVSDDGC